MMCKFLDYPSTLADERLLGWEYPALTRNSNVKTVSRVDPDTADDPRVIWTQGNAKTNQEPKGSRGATTPSYES